MNAREQALADQNPTFADLCDRVRVARLAHLRTSEDRFAVVTVTIDAVTYVIVDIGMRMLTRRELANAQGFPPGYILDPIGPAGKPLSISSSIRMIGNSVCPDMAEALARANVRLGDAEAQEAA